MTVSGSISILHVDDEPDVGDLAASFLEREDERFDVEVATSAAEGLDRLAEANFDCVVSDYDMPHTNGIEFLDRVRDEYPDLPFVLFTGKGGEEIASEAISTGVTDYLQKQADTSQYELLANRIRNAVESYRAEQRARRQQRQHRELFDQAPVMYVVTRDVDGRLRVEDCNDLFAEKLGYDHEEVIGRPISEFYTDEARRKMHQEGGYERALRGEFGSEERTLSSKDGETIETINRATPLFDEQGDSVGVQALYLDITERRVHEGELEEYREYTDRILDAIDDVFFVYDEEGTLQRWNESFADVTGYSEEDLASMNAVEFIPEAHRERTAAAIRDVFETGHARLEAPALTRDGGTIPYEYVANRVEHPDGGSRLVGIGRDITERTERERELQRQNERLEEFASMVSHDLRNPLNVAGGRLALAQEECDSEHLADVERALDRMEVLIDDILTDAREGTAVEATEPIDLAAVVDACWRNVETADATLAVDAAQTIYADPGRFRQLLENLFRNAVEHGSRAVTVTVGSLADGRGFYVEDDGPGVPADEREQVFESGYSTTTDGTGFGLAIVREIVEAHGWSITLTESVDGGARFEITGVELDTG